MNIVAHPSGSTRFCPSALVFGEAGDSGGEITFLLCEDGAPFAIRGVESNNGHLLLEEAVM